MGAVDYNALSSSYGRRYEENPLAGVERCLRGAVRRVWAERVLDVGCGTGRWLPILARDGARVVGIDPYLGMLARATGAQGRPSLVCADGDLLPLAPRRFDLLTLINAVHELADPEAHMKEAFALLRPGGEIALVHYDPSQPGQSWYVYDYFEGTLADDLDRFPRIGRIAHWLRFSGFVEIETAVAEVIERRYSGAEVLSDYFLGHSSNSTLARLTQSAYDRGVERLRHAIDLAGSEGRSLDLGVRIELLLLTARRPVD